MASKLRRQVMGAAVALVCSLPCIVAPQGIGGAVAIDADDIGGLVTSAKGPEAGVWVIAETTDLPTKFARIVVTDDRGRYLLPDLPMASYNVWVRGYGLVDSRRVEGRPGRALNLAAVIAPTPQAAAQYYPPNYWLSLMRLPDGPDQPRAGAAGRCGLACHQMGGKATREISPETTAVLGPFDSTADAWLHRVRSGPTGAFMSQSYGQIGPRLYPAWTDRVLAGAVPKEPPRPRGVERNLVISLWDWGAVNGFVHDQAPADRRNPVVPPGTLIYGPAQSHDMLVWFDPVHHREGSMKIPTRDTDLPSGAARWPGRSVSPGSAEKGAAAVPLLARRGNLERGVGATKRPDGRQGPHLGGFRIRRDEKQPAFCRSGSSNRFARYFPLDPRPNSNIGGKQTGFYDPKTRAWTLIDVCWWFDHSAFVTDADHTLYSGMDNVLGWINTRRFDETHDEQASQGWCPAVLDTNGDGKITEWTEPNQPTDPTKDQRITFTCYSVGASPVDGAAWCNGAGRADRPHRARAEPARDMQGRALSGAERASSRRRARR